MEQVRQAKRDFKASCGHAVAAGAKFLVVQENPKFYCATCGPKLLAEKLQALRKEFGLD